MSEEIVYFIGMKCPEMCVKIGKTRDIKSRLTALKTNIPYDIWLIATLLGYKEGDLHNRFCHLRLSGEWFRLTNEIKSFIVKHCQNNKGKIYNLLELESNNNEFKPIVIVDKLKMVGIGKLKSMDINADIIRDLYWEKELSTIDIGKKYGVYSQNISMFMQQSNIPLRSESQRGRIAYNKMVKGWMR